VKQTFKIEYLLLILNLLVISLTTDGNDSKGKRISVLPVPAFGYTPETHTYLGAVTLFTIRKLDELSTRTSNAKVEFNYTWNNQMIWESDWNYFFPYETWFTRGIVHYSKYPDLYWGIGSHATGLDEINFESNRFILSWDGFRSIYDKRYLGAGVSYKTYRNIRQDSVFFSELREESSYELKVLFLKDSRNNILSPSEGNYFEFSNSFLLASSFYYRAIIDYRLYKNFGELDNQVLAGRFYHTSIFGNPPFFDYAMIGGDEYVRGYYLGRFRDKNLSTVQMEYRNQLFRKIGIATFGGVSIIYRGVGTIKMESLKPNAGLGLRFLIDKKENTNLRIDYAIGMHNQSGFYISFGESF
jgi:hypothetical protein